MQLYKNKFIEIINVNKKDFLLANELHWSDYDSMSDEFVIDTTQKLKKINIKNILDIGSGTGRFIYQCLLNDIDAYGIEPSGPNWNEKVLHLHQPHEVVKKTKDRTFRITYQHMIKIIKDKNINFKWDCISLINALHGSTMMSKNEVVDLFNFFKKYAKYILIGELPTKFIKTSNFLDDNFELIDTTIEYDENHTNILHHIYKNKEYLNENN